ncbi:hypothetical protein KP509_08G061900 [Ceratopteris richardii]|uniref:Uncharacterized protein n=1 Tax=Ceratopteris richardii TaxID=49495 RepID=A0A8T2U799_CERRI|nr:hypothetical protein KP509_08G061900 [Ceratopteris richardii]
MVRPAQYVTPARPVSAKIIMLVNAITLLLSIVLLAEGIWLRERRQDDCSSHLQWFVISIAIIMFVVSLVGFTGARQQTVGLLWLYIALLTLIVVLLIVFTVFAFYLKHHGFSTYLGMPANLIHGNFHCTIDFLNTFKKDWATVATTSLVVLIVLLFLYAIACSAFMHAINRRAFRSGFV